jgi:hypothetical protein
MASSPYDGRSADPNVPGITGENTAAGNGVFGSSQGNDGVLGITFTAGHAGVAGRNDHGGPGVVGISAQSNGVLGASLSSTDAGVAGTNSGGGRGVYGESTGNEGVRGISHSPDHAGVSATNDGGGYGVYAESSGVDAVRAVGHSAQNAAVGASNDGGAQGVYAWSQGNDGVVGISHSAQHAGVAGVNDNSGNGVYGKSSGSGFAGYFDGNVNVTNTLTVKVDIVLTNADCAEEFDVAEAAGVEPGTVMVLGQDGALQPSQQAYDKRVAGVISGAGDYKPGIVLDKQQPSEDRMPVALVGKVYCKVDAHYASIEVGDLLTTSPTPGHAMKAVDPFQAFGAVMGKALQPFDGECGLIPILVTLQ